VWINVGELKISVDKSEGVKRPTTPPSMLMYYVYILKINSKFYIGYTEDLQRKFKQHKSEGKTELVYYEAYLLKKSATTREKKLKHYGSAWRALRKRITA